jgi:hypothetical protein
MAWNNPVINGANSVASNKTPLNENSAYIETSMQLDHYWDENANLDGRHKQVNMPNQSPDPSIGTDCDGVIFHKEITKNAGGTTENVAVHKNSSMVNYLGIRAWVNFDYNGATTTITVKSQYGVTSVTKLDKGRFQITFSQTLPTNNYVISGTAIRTNTDQALYITPRDNGWDSYQTTTDSIIDVIRGTQRIQNNESARVCVMWVGG